MRSFKFLFIILFVLAASSCSKAPPPTVMVVFGATGDLTARKILPAVETLAGEGRLPEKFAVVGVARRAKEEFRKQIVFSQKLYYCQTSFEEEEGYERLAGLLDQIDRDFGAKSNRIYFLSTQPSYFSPIIEQLSKHNLIYKPGEKQWSRVMIEKPFGHDLESALALQNEISQLLDESQIYRIDHYLGKEGVQNLIDFRLKGELEPIWNKEHIDHVKITLSENLGVGTRTKLWEETGLLRDVVQNHIMQLFSLVAMDLGHEKIKVLESTRPIETFVLGQYGPGVINGLPVPGYLQEKDVPASSSVETYIDAQLFIDNDRWKGVPFQIHSGKRLAAQLTEIVVTFKSNDVLHIRIQPNPAIFFENGKQFATNPFPYSEAYQKLIYDCIRGDKSSFVPKEEQFAAWRILEPALHAKSQLISYPAGDF